METKSYVRKPFEVTAVRVTSDNFYEVAKWCQGDVNTEDGAKFIRVRVVNAISPRQTQAFEGDWVLYASTGYKVYTDKAFHKSFDEKKTPPEQLPTSASISPPLQLHNS